jgi:hypothetical protein
MSRDNTALLYRAWHLRDVAWSENADGEIGCVHRNWEPTIANLHQTFGDKGLAPPLMRELSKNPFRTVKIRHIVTETRDYAPGAGMNRWREPYVSLYIDMENEWLIEERGIFSSYYIIPRWQLVEGSQYAFSPATIAALPDARLLQAMTLTLLEAGERAASPPMTAVQGAIRSDINLRTDGITWVDRDYDARTGEALSPIKFDRSGIQYGLQMQSDTKGSIGDGLYLNKIGLPPSEREQTAYEMAQRLQEYIRQTIPLFAPMNPEYNGQVCGSTFGLLMRAMAFGPADDIPQSLRGANVEFHFESPLLQAEGAERGAIFSQGTQLLAAAAQLDPAAGDIVDTGVALRDALYGIGTPAKWLRTPEEIAARAEQREKEQALSKMVAGAGQAGMAAEAVGKGAQALAPQQKVSA